MLVSAKILYTFSEFNSIMGAYSDINDCKNNTSPMLLQGLFLRRNCPRMEKWRKKDVII